MPGPGQPQLVPLLPLSDMCSDDSSPERPAERGQQRQDQTKAKAKAKARAKAEAGHKRKWINHSTSIMAIKSFL